MKLYAQRIRKREKEKENEELSADRQYAYLNESR